MPRKGKRLKFLAPGQIAGAATINELIGFYNAFMNARSDASIKDIQIADNNIVLPSGDSNNNGGGSDGPVWLP